MANKLIQQPDILSLDTLGSFMDAQNDPIAAVVDKEETKVAKVEENASEVDSEEVVQNVVQEESSESEVTQVDTTPQRPKVVKKRRGKQSSQPVIEAGSGEWDMMVRYAEFYNENPDENRITVVLNPDIKKVLDIIRINCRQFNFGNILNAVCRTFIERNKEQIQHMQKDKGSIL
ncbi:MAG: hypothetical protein IJQ60_10505 [Prevotella sp.]|nr:hypothetical protein [Prevotella sp.]